jgi:hypothetical protein
MAPRVSKRVKAHLDDIWSYVATESGSLEIADRVIATITDTFVHSRSILSLAVNVTTSAQACEVFRPGAV